MASGEPLLDWQDLEREIVQRRGRSLKVTFFGAGVQIFASRGVQRNSLAASGNRLPERQVPLRRGSRRPRPARLPDGACCGAG